MNGKVRLEYAVQLFLLCCETSHDLIYLRYNGTKQGSSAEEEEDAVDLQAVP